MYRFGAFQVDPREHELRRSGVRIRVQEQPFVVLLKLLERPGQLVTREDLRLAIWPADTFVDFDTGLNTVIKRLREVLRDSADVPIFIETVPKLGYRFIAPVQFWDGEGMSVGPTRNQKRKSAVVKWVAAGAVLLLATGMAYWLSQRIPDGGDSSPEIVPLTGMPGAESDAAFSPDGNQVAFSLSDDSRNGRSGIYTTFVGGEKALQLTNDPDDCCPAWSPDGRSLAFARNTLHTSTIYALPALGGTLRKLYSIKNNYEQHAGNLPRFSWSPDGRFLAVSTPAASVPASAQPRQAIALLSLADSTIRPLTSPAPEFTDWSPSFSPDGQSIAFIRSSGPGFVNDLYVMPVNGGEPKRLTFDNRDISSAPSWTPDGREIIFDSARSGLSGLWRISASGGILRRLEGVGAYAFEPAVSLKGQRLAYLSELRHTSLWKVALRNTKLVTQPPQLLLATKGEVGLPYFSPDGRKIAFESTQSGYDEIWTLNSDGSNPAQLTFLNGFSGTPRWSYDGRFVAFDYRPGDHSEIYVAEASGGPPHILPTIPGGDNTVPSWSRDGKWLYFASNRGDGPTQVWKVPYPAGGTPVQLTKTGGVSPIESADGFVYYPKSLQTDEIWKISTNGGEEILAMKGTGLNDCWNWALGPAGIYFITDTELRYFEFATRKTFLMTKISHSGNPAVSPDGKSLVFSRLDQADKSIMLVNHFR